MARSPVLTLVLLLALALAQPPDAPSACRAYRDIAPTAPAPHGAQGCAAALEDACEAGTPLACAALGRVVAAGVAGTPDPVRALALYARACTANVADACADLAELRRHRGDAAGSRQALEEGCAAGSGRACATLAFDEPGGARASRLAERACDLGVADGCLALLARAPPARADALLARACRLGADDACTAASAPTLDARCGRDDGEACLTLGVLLQEGRLLPGDGARAAALYALACGRGVAAGCERLGILYRFGAGVAVDEARARRLLDRACTLGDAEGCRLRDDPVRLEP